MTDPSCAPRPAVAGHGPLRADDAASRRRRAVRRVAGRRSTDESITAVLLDIGGVVIPTLFESVAAPGFPGGPFAGDEEYRAVETGDLSERDYWSRWMRRRPDIDVGALWRSCSYVRAEVRTLITELGGSVALVAFTNDMAHWFGARWPDRFPELAAFDTVVEAAKLGVLKPDPAAFTLAAEVLDEDPRRCLFVDDLPANLSGAEQVGMGVELFDVLDAGGSVTRVLQRVRPRGGTRRVFALPRATLS